MKYVLHGKPIPLARPRFSGNRVYNKQYISQMAIRTHLRMIQGSHPILKGPIKLEVAFFMPMPSSWSSIKKHRMAGKPHIFTPDFSNMLKFYEDCATGICYVDDKLIYSVSGYKVYDWYPRTELTISEFIHEKNNKE